VHPRKLRSLGRAFGGMLKGLLAIILLCLAVWGLEVYSPEMFWVSSAATGGETAHPLRGVFTGAVFVLLVALSLYIALAALLASLRMNGMPLTLVLWVLMMIPGVGLFVLLFVYLQTKYQLKANGVRTGFLGVDWRSYPAVTSGHEHLPAGMSDPAAVFTFVLISIAGSLALASVVGLFFLSSLPSFLDALIRQNPASSLTEVRPMAEAALDQEDDFVEPPWDTMEEVEEFTEIDDDVLPETVQRAPEATEPGPVMIAMREWTNREGVVMRAELRSVALNAEGKYEGTFVRNDGKTFQYRIARLSDSDIATVKSAMESPKLDL
jgi:hypothetical protein